MSEEAAELTTGRGNANITEKLGAAEMLRPREGGQGFNWEIIYIRICIDRRGIAAVGGEFSHEYGAVWGKL